nr:unnamed protein product [Callosobruchus analis]
MCSKWRILHRAIDVKLEFSEDILKAICLLHNFIRIRNGFTNEDATHTAPLSNMHTGLQFEEQIKLELHLQTTL